MYKPEIDIIHVTTFLEDWANGPVRDVAHIDAGFVSTIFSFERVVGSTGSSEKLIGKFSSHENEGGLEKNEFVGDLSKDAGIPTAQHLSLGHVELPVRNLTPEDRGMFSADSYPLTYSIIRWVEGNHFPDLQNPSSSPWIPTAINLISKISSVDISSTTGWGWFGPDGIGKYDTWNDHLIASCFDRSTSRLLSQRPERFRSDFLDVETFEYFSAELREMASVLPEIRRCLVHTDFGWDNVLVDDHDVKAVIDWDNAVFGDELYDLARLNVYAPRLDLMSLVKAQWKTEGRDTRQFELRWKVCALHIILDTLGWYGWSDAPEQYRWMKARGLEFLGAGPPVVEPQPASDE